MIWLYNKKLHNILNYQRTNESSNCLLLLKGNKNNLETLPIRAYLDETVIPLVLKALSELTQ